MRLDNILRNDENFKEGLNALLNTELEPILFDDNDKFNTVWGLFESANKNQGLMKALNRNATDLLSVLDNQHIASELKEVTKIVFPRKNIETGLKDAPLNAYYSVYIPLALYCRLIVPQLDSQNRLYFNATGEVTVADFFDSYNALYEGYNSDLNKHTSLDEMSYENDYFNQGYNRIVNTYDNPIYALYSRAEFVRPIMRVEVAYILLFGLQLFDTNKDNYINSGYKAGYSFDWVTDTLQYLQEYTDCKDLQVCVKQEKDRNPFDIKTYLGENTLYEYLDQVKTGHKYIALPLIASLLEMCNHDIMYALTNLNPFMSLSRGELVYIMFKVSNVLYSKKVEDRNSV